MLIEDLHEPAHVCPFVLVRQVHVHVDPCDRLLLPFVLVEHGDRITDALDPDLVDIDPSGIFLLLYVFHVSSFAPTAVNQAIIDTSTGKVNAYPASHSGESRSPGSCDEPYEKTLDSGFHRNDCQGRHLFLSRKDPGREASESVTNFRILYSSF